MDEAILRTIGDLIGKSFAQNGGTYTNGTGTITNPSGTIGVFIPDEDGTFGVLKGCNITGLSGSAFKAGIPKYFIATEVALASGSGTFYFN